MKNGMLLLLVVFGLWFVPVSLGLAGPAAAGWQAGVARVNITPEQPLWMAGFGVRTKPSEGTRLPLWVKALAMKDANGKKVVLVTSDLLGFPKDVSDKIRARLQTRYGLEPAQVLLNSSHTHSAPVLGNALSDVYPMDEKEWEKVPVYTRKLENQVVEVVGTALGQMEPVQLFAQNGVTRFQVNRRNNREAALLQQTELKGPNDYAVPVIKIADARGKLKAIAFGYACHPTVLNDYKWSGDYPGYAQLELEKAHPGATALFFQGAGADQNALPRGTEALARQYGRELAAAVNRVLEEDMRQLPAAVKTAYTEINLPLSSPPTAVALNQLISETNVDYYKRWANRLLAEMHQGKAFRTQYPYPLQVWQLGDQVIMALGGELVVEYAIRLKQLFGPGTFVVGYANDVMAYIPSEKILREGGYEGETSQRAYGLHTTWAPGLEDMIISKLTSLAGQIGVAPATANTNTTK